MAQTAQQSKLGSNPNKKEEKNNNKKRLHGKLKIRRKIIVNNKKKKDYLEKEKVSFGFLFMYN